MTTLGELDDPRSRLALALLVPSKDDLAEALRHVPAHEVKRLGDGLGLPKPMLARSAPVVLRALHRRTGGVVPEVAFLLANGCIDDTIEALGDRHEDPSMEDMLEVLPAVIDKHGAALVAIMLAAYPVIEAPCSAVFDELLRTDERFSTLTASEPELRETADVPLARPPAAADPEQAAKVEARRRRREEKKAQRAKEKQRGRASGPPSRKKPARNDPPPPESSPEPAAPGVTAEPERREIRPHGTHAGVQLDHPDVGSVVAADVVFDDKVGSKVRPVVVIAVTDEGYVVRPCSSDGGSVSRNWKSTPLEKWFEAGLEQPTWVSTEERVVRHDQIGHRIGRVATEDWNQL